MDPSSPNQNNQPVPNNQYPLPAAAYPTPQQAAPVAPVYAQQPAAAGIPQAAQSQAMYAQPTQPYQQVMPPTPGAPTENKLPVAKSNPNSTQNTLQIAEVRDGIVIMNDGSYRSVIMVKSINFDLMSLQEQEAVESGYQGFLNSLYFPVQIFIRSQKVDLQPYIERLDKIRTEHDNMLLSLLMEDYIHFMSDLSLQTNIMDKKFYVVIPYFPVADVQKAITSSKSFFSGLAGLFNSKDHHVVINEAELEQAKTELRNRVQSVLGGLMQCGVQGLPLDTQELIELYYDTYNPDTATRQQLKNFNDLTAPIITKGQGVANQPNLDRSLL